MASTREEHILMRHFQMSSLLSHTTTAHVGSQHGPESIVRDAETVVLERRMVCRREMPPGRVRLS